MTLQKVRCIDHAALPRRLDSRSFSTTQDDPRKPFLMTHPSQAVGDLTAAFTPGPWFAGPLQPEDEYGGPGDVSIGPYDIATKYGARADYSPETFNDHYEDAIARASGCNHDAVANARLIAAAPDLLERLHWAVTAAERLVLVTPKGLLRTGIEAGVRECHAAINKALNP